MIKTYLKRLLAVSILISSSIFSIYSLADENLATNDIILEKSLSSETLNDILLAEFANTQQDYKYALTLYLKQAKQTKDTEVAKRATRIAQHLRDINAVTESVKIWSESAPTATEPHQLLANILIAEGKFQEALPHFNTALKQGENKVLLSLSSQASLMDKQEVQAYIKLLNAADNTKKAINNGYAITLGILNNRINQHEIALKNFNDALVTTPDSSIALYQKVITLKDLKRFEDALNALTPLLSTKKTTQQYNALHVQLLFLLKRNTDAIHTINNLLKSNPQDYAFHQYFALIAFDYKEHKKSEEIFTNLLTINPKKTAPYFYLGLIAEQNENSDKALENYLKATDKNILLQAQTQAIALHKTTDDKQKVINLIKDFKSSNISQNINYTLLLARWLNENEFKQEAINALKKELVNHPDSTELIYAHAMYIETLDFLAAEKDFKRLLELEPNNAVFLNAYGYTLTVHTTRYKEALILIEKALTISPKDPATIDSIGWVKYKLKQYPEAVKYLSQAYLLYQDSEVAFHLIAALLGVNEIDKARTLFEKMSANYPNNQFVEKARKLLENKK